ncbi:hypothetical protein Pint_11237 [Pistacia integerrima]|uniref:Uncharacterized protein n=1 Tax=Pistacia integerrima TaxID=434235 RepID=A0ACC0XFN2_9ROSI|nr:hypothetical protein Pint_11237 [Pistacia integerrima]
MKQSLKTSFYNCAPVNYINVEPRFEEQNQTQRAFGWAASDSSGTLHPFHFARRANGENDITLKILYCGICRADLDTVNNTYGISLYPVLPGCDGCQNDLESYCPKSITTYTIFDNGGDKNYGGYSTFLLLINTLRSYSLKIGIRGSCSIALCGNHSV